MLEQLQAEKCPNPGPVYVQCWQQIGEVSFQSSLVVNNFKYHFVLSNYILWIQCPLLWWPIKFYDILLNLFESQLDQADYISVWYTPLVKKKISWKYKAKVMGGVKVKCHIEHDVQSLEIKTLGNNSNFGIKKHATNATPSEMGWQDV